jgi:NADPH-dependent 2,4-dienoyl-CoA reductase/sulfur reductase-like enzyme
MIEELRKRNVRVHLGTKCIGISDDGVLAEDLLGNKTLISTDCVVNSLGMRSSEFSVDLNNLPSAEVFFVGDCLNVGKVSDAVSSAYRAAMSIL